MLHPKIANLSQLLAVYVGVEGKKSLLHPKIANLFQLLTACLGVGKIIVRLLPKKSLNFYKKLAFVGV